MLKPEAAVSEEVQPSTEDLATYDFMALLPKFNEKIEELSNRQLKRVTSALMEYPLGKSTPHFPYMQERELFELGSKLLDCKFVIVRAVMNMSKEEIEKLSKEIKDVSVQSVLSSAEPGRVSEERNELPNVGTSGELSGSPEGSS